MADDPTPTDDTDTLGDAGKKALDQERKARRDAERKLSTLEAELQELRDRDKSDSERLTTKNAALEKELAEAIARADRFEVALEKGLDPVRAKRLTGSTRAELEADADELATWTAAAGDDADTKPPATPGKPAADLKGGGDPTQEPVVDVKAIVDSIDRRF